MDKQEIIKTRAVLNKLKQFIEQSTWKGDYLHRIETLLYRVEQPCELAVAGRVKAGKSSFLNALLGEDLAMVGTTETTATINFFRYGTSEDPEKPIRVIWNDGREEYQSKEFLDSLQGNTKEVLDRAKGIDRLEYLIENDILKYVTLVDTPGTDALVDEHEKQTDKYFSKERVELRERQSKQSKNLTERADAVIFITADKVPTQQSKLFMHKYFGYEGHSSTAMNAIGMMTKIDLMTNSQGELLDYDKIREMGKSLATVMRDELNDVMPVSAGLYRELQILDKRGAFAHLQENLKQIPDSFFEALFDDSDIYLTEEEFYKEACIEAGVEMLSIRERREMKGSIPWRTFIVIAKELYSNPLEVAIKNLYSYSGMNEVKSVLERHFFQRSRTIRCFSILNDLHKILNHLLRIELRNIKLETAMQDKFEEFIGTHPARFSNSSIVDSLLKFVNRNIHTVEQINKYEDIIKDIINEVEILQRSFYATDQHNAALILLSKCVNDLSSEQYYELEMLFGKYHDSKPLYDGKRQLYWNRQKILATDSNTLQVIQLTIDAYGRL